MRLFDPTLYPSPRLAMQAPSEGLAYVTTGGVKGQADGLWVVDLDPLSPSYGERIYALEVPYVGDEIHHLSWNVCSSALCPFASSLFLEQRYLLMPGLRSSWYRKAHRWALRKVIEIAAEASNAQRLPPIPKMLQAVPPLVTDIKLSLDDRVLYVSCWGSGDVHQYDVSDAFHPRLIGAIRLGGIGHHTFHPRGGRLTGGPQMIEISRDGRRVYVTNAFYSRWDEQLYPDLRGWLVKLDAHPKGGIALDPDFFVDCGENRPRRVRLQGGDGPSDSFCYA